MRRRSDKIATCPFCGEAFKRPEDIRTPLGNIFTGGKCECGAVYIFDRSGHNLGEAYVDGLVFACGNDWERAMSLTPDVDYETRSFYYEQSSHQLAESVRRGIRTNENILFIKLNPKVQVETKKTDKNK